MITDRSLIVKQKLKLCQHIDIKDMIKDYQDDELEILEKNRSFFILNGISVVF